jgi:mitotic spindle assembly checkpoint protein MAD1
LQNQAVNERASLEKQLRESEKQNTSLREDLEDALGQLADLKRQYEDQIKDVEVKRIALQETVDRFKDGM